MLLRKGLETLQDAIALVAKHFLRLEGIGFEQVFRLVSIQQSSVGDYSDFFPPGELRGV